MNTRFFSAGVVCLFGAMVCGGSFPLRSGAAESAPARAPKLEIRLQGRALALPKSDESRIVEKIEALVSSANFNSRDHRELFPEEASSAWTPAAKLATGRSFLHLSYPGEKAFSTAGRNGGGIAATDVWVEIKEKNPQGGLYPGPVTLVRGGDAVRLSKVSGMLTLGLGLDPALFPRLPDDMRKTLEAGRAAYEAMREQARAMGDAPTPTPATAQQAEASR